MNQIDKLKAFLGTNNDDKDVVRTLYFVMQKVGGYEQLMKLSIPTINEIIKCMEWENKEQEKAMRRKK